MLATMVGYLLVVVIAIVAFRFVLGTLFWLLRTVLVVVVIGGLLVLYLKLKTPDDER